MVTKWTKNFKKSMSATKINLAQLDSQTNNDIIEKVKKWASAKWRSKIQTKSTLRMQWTLGPQI